MGGKVGGINIICDAQAVANQNTVYSKSLNISSCESFGLWIKATSALGAPDLKIELEESYTLPSTEGSADTNYVVPDGVSDLYANLTVETAKIKQFSPVAMPYVRLKITGNAANPADTVITVRAFTQEML